MRTLPEPSGPHRPEETGDHRGLAALGLLLQGLCGQERILETRPPPPPDGPAARAVLTATHLLLAPSDTQASPPEHHALARATVAHAAAHLLYSPAASPAGRLKPLGLAVASAIEDARAEALLLRRLPGLQRWWLRSLPAPRTAGEDFTGLMARLGRALLDPQQDDENAWIAQARHLFTRTQQTQGLEDYAAFRALASRLANDLGQMRVRFNDRLYAVPEPWRDDNSYLWRHGASPTDAPEPLTVHLPRGPTDAVPPPPSSPPPHEVAPPMAPAPVRYPYPEWDHRLQRLRPDWCTVLDVSVQPSEAPPAPARTPARLALPRACPVPGAPRLRRQRDGEDIDLNAAIDLRIAQRGGLPPEEGLFTRSARHGRSQSLLLLLDLSASSNDPVAGTEHTVLDLEKTAALQLAHAALAHGDRMAVHGFCSDTRAAVHYRRLLDFGAPLDGAAQHALQSAPAAFSTRLGTALRHATHCLAGETTAHRAIVVLTDGAPSDIDVFDPHSLVQDARAAVHAARRQQVEVCCLALDARADAGLRQMFGASGYRVASSAMQLPAQLISLYAWLSVR